MTTYPTIAKDKGFQNKPVNYAECFGLPLNSVHLALINSCKYIFKDRKGSYTYNAVSFDENGNVTFVKEYR